MCTALDATNRLEALVVFSFSLRFFNGGALLIILEVLSTKRDLGDKFAGKVRGYLAVYTFKNLDISFYKVDYLWVSPARFFKLFLS